MGSLCSLVLFLFSALAEFSFLSGSFCKDLFVVGSYTVDIVGAIASSAFYNYDSLTSVTNGDSDTSIGS